MKINPLDDTDTDIDAPVPPICATVGHQIVELCVPISIHPFANVGIITTKCCDRAVITHGETCEGTVDGYCNFTIKQKICVEIPIEFGAKTESGETFVACGITSTADIPCDRLCEMIDYDNLNEEIIINKI